MEWQPIQTAPKGGQRVLLYLERDRPFVPHAVIGFWGERGEWTRDGGGSWEGPGWTVSSWAPLPEQPK